MTLRTRRETETSTRVNTHILVFDSYCRICNLFRSLVEALDVRDEVNPIDMRTDLAQKLLQRLPPHIYVSSFHLVDPDGEIHSGGEAVPHLVSLLLAGRHVNKLIHTLPYGEYLVERVYEKLASSREVMCCG